MSNKDVAVLLAEQTYDERMAMALFISQAASDDAKNEGIEALDSAYFAQLLESWTDSELEDHP